MDLNMHPLPRTLIAALLLIGTPGAFAASTVDLAVRGLIIPTACTPTLSAGGIVDHGKLSAADLYPDRETELTRHVLKMEIRCDAKTLIALKGTDNRPESFIDLSRGGGYGLGLINGDQKLGTFELWAANLVADDAPSSVLKSTNLEQWTEFPSTTYWPTDSYISAGTPGVNTPVALQTLVFDLRIDTIIASALSLDLSNEVALDGSATLEVKYL